MDPEVGAPAPERNRRSRPFRAGGVRNKEPKRYGLAPIGPSPVDQDSISANGRATAIAVNSNNPKVIYIGIAWVRRSKLAPPPREWRVQRTGATTMDPRWQVCRATLRQTA